MFMGEDEWTEAIPPVTRLRPHFFTSIIAANVCVFEYLINHASSLN